MEEDKNIDIRDPSSDQEIQFSETTREFMAVAMRRMAPEADISDKITESHIDTMLKNDRLQIEEKGKFDRLNLLFKLLVLVVVSGVVITLIVLLKDSPEVMEKVLYACGGLVAGAVGGYGYGKSKSNDD